jgi:hypothetical protein
MDSDIAVFKDFVPLLKEQLKENLLLFQCDEKLEDSFECSNTNACTNPCTGVIAMALTEVTRPHFKNLYKVESEPWGVAMTDQDYIANRLIALQIPYKTLNRGDFPNGIFLAKDRYKETNPYLVHFNYIVGKTKQKIMMEKECWTLPEYV